MVLVRESGTRTPSLPLVLGALEGPRKAPASSSSSYRFRRRAVGQERPSKVAWIPLLTTLWSTWSSSCPPQHPLHRPRHRGPTVSGQAQRPASPRPRLRRHRRRRHRPPSWPPTSYRPRAYLASQPPSLMPVYRPQTFLPAAAAGSPVEPPTPVVPPAHRHPLAAPHLRI